MSSPHEAFPLANSDEPVSDVSELFIQKFCEDFSDPASLQAALQAFLAREQ